MKLVIAAAGTGGHIIPALNIARYLQQQNKSTDPHLAHSIDWIGTPTGMENNLVPQHHISIHAITFAGVRNKGLIKWVNLPLSLLKATKQALNHLNALQPDVVLVMGGYVSAPTAIAAWLKRTPLIIHEQNAVAGLANKFCALFASKVCYAFPNSFKNNPKKFILTGNPINTQVNTQEQDKPTHNHPQDFHILILGGSLGAQKINTILPQALKKLQHTIGHKLIITHQCGKNNLHTTEQHYQATTLDVKIIEFSESLPQLYQQANLIIARAGAMSVAEIASLGCPALFIPYPYAVNDHQYYNALSLTENPQNSAYYHIIRDDQLSAEKSADILAQLYQIAQQKPRCQPSTNHRLATKHIVDIMQHAIDNK